MTAVDHEKDAEKREYKRTVGDFDAYVMDEMERKEREAFVPTATITHIARDLTPITDMTKKGNV